MLHLRASQLHLFLQMECDPQIAEQRLARQQAALLQRQRDLDHVTSAADACDREASRVRFVRHARCAPAPEHLIRSRIANAGG